MLFSFGFLHSQDTLPNMNFENWTSYGLGAYQEPSGGVWATANSVVLMAMPVTTERTTDAVSGTYAAKMTTKQATITTPPMLITGTLCTGVFNSAATSNNMKFGKPFTGRPLRFTGYYKYYNNAGDSCDIYATLTKWTGTTREVVGKATLRSHDSVLTYTKFNLLFVYNSGDIPDSITVVFASSAAGDVMKGHVGSTLYIDNTNLDYTNGINELTKPSVKVKCFPIPAKTAVNFVLEKNIINGSIKIFNELGSEIKMINIINKEFSISVKDLSKGKYFYQIIEKNSILNSGYFLVN